MKFWFLFLRFSLMLAQRVLYILSAGQWPPFASVAVLVHDGDKLLMLERRDGRGYGLPGGYIKMNETAEQAACRETKEETGYEIELMNIKMVLSGIRKSTFVRAVDIIYTARIVGGRLRPSSEGTPRWVVPGEVRNRIAFDYLTAIDA